MKKRVTIAAGLLAAVMPHMPSASAQISLANGLQTVAGSGMAGYSGDGSAAASSNLNLPSGVAVDPGRNIFIADTDNHAIRRVDAVTGSISTFAGIGYKGISVDGTAAASSPLNSPGGVAIDANGDVFIADTGNSRIVVVYEGGSAAAALITAENSAITTPVIGAMYTIAGNATAGYSGDSATALSSQLNSPAHVAVDSQGAVYIADTGNQRVRVVYTGGASAKSYITAANSTVATPVVGSIYTIAGSGTAGSTGDGALAGSATLNSPVSVVLDLQNNVYIAEKSGNRVRAIFLSGTSLSSLIALESSGNTAKADYIYTLAGTGTAGEAGDGALASAATLSQPTGLAIDAAGNVYIADSANGIVREIAAATGNIAVYAGNAALGHGFSGDGGLATLGQFQTPADVALDPASGALYIADSTGGQRVRSVSKGTLFPTTPVTATSAAQKVLLQFGAADTLNSIAVVPSVTTAEYKLGQVTNCPADGTTVIAAGTVCSIAISFTPQFPGQRAAPLVVTDTAGVQYPFALTGLATGPLASIVPGQMLTVAGTGVFAFKGDGGPATAATLSEPYNVSVDAAGNIFINDKYSHRIRVIYAGGQTVAHLITLENPTVTSPVAGNIYTIAGNGTTSTTYATGGLASSTPLSYAITGLAVDADDNIYIDDQGSERVVMVSAATGKLLTVAGVAGSAISAPSSGDYGPATSASLYLSGVIATDSFGNLYIGNGTNQIRKVSLSTGIITTVAGVGGTASSASALDGGPALLAKFSSLQSLYIDAYQNIYVGDPGSLRIAIIYSGGASNPAASLILVTHSGLTAPVPGYIYTVGGNGTSGYSGNGGLATQAALGYFNQFAVDAAGNIYLGDRTSNYIRKIDGKTGIIRTIAGTGAASAASDGKAATSAALNSPYGLATDSLGNVYVSDFYNNRIREITATGYPLTFAAAVGSTSTAQNVLLSNTGNTPFTPTALTTTADFTTTSSSVCAAGTALASGDDCLTAVAFSPHVNGITNGTLTFTSAALNPTLTLTGTGSGGVTTATSLTAPASAVYGQLIPVKSTVTAGGSPVISGTVIFTAGSTTLGSAQLDSTGTATASIPTPIVGTYQLTATFQQTGVNMSSSAAVALSVRPAPLTVTADNKSMVYGSQVPALTYSVNGLVNGDTAAAALSGTASLTTTATSTSDTGSYPITIAQGTLNAANYTLSFVNGVLTVSGSTSQTITFGSVPNTTYGAAPFTLSPTSSSALPVTLAVVSGPASVSGYTVTMTGAGTVVLQAVQSGNKQYAAASVQRSFTVAQAGLVIAVKNASRLYGAADPAFTGTVTGFVNGDTVGSTLTVAYQSADTAFSPVGTYPIQAKLSGPSAANYSVTATAGVLTITQEPLTLTIASTSRVYGASNPTFTASLSGLVNGDSLTTNISEQFTTSATVISPVGAYPITGSISGTGSGNYSLIVVPGTLTVTPAPLTASATSVSRTYGQPNPSFTGTFSGALNGDVFTESFTTTATQTTNAGRYSIVPSVSGPALSNYKVSTTNGVLTIYLANSITTLAVSGATVSYGSSVVLSANAISSTIGTPTGSVSFYDGSTLLGTSGLSSGTATYTASGLLVGSHAVSATYSGDYDFYGSSTVQTSVSVVAPNYTITPSATALTLAGQQVATDTLAIAGIGGYGGTITFSCANVPTGLQCAFSPNTTTLSSTARSQSVALTVSRTTQAQVNGREKRKGMELAGVGGFGALLLLCLTPKSRKKLQSGLLLTVGVFLLAATSGLAGCASSNPSSTPPAAAGTYQILVQANANSGSSTTLPLTVTIQ